MYLNWQRPLPQIPCNFVWKISTPLKIKISLLTSGGMYSALMHINTCHLRWVYEIRLLTTELPKLESYLISPQASFNCVSTVNSLWVENCAIHLWVYICFALDMFVSRRKLKICPIAFKVMASINSDIVTLQIREKRTNCLNTTLPKM